MKKDDRPQVYKSNALIEAHFTMSLMEQRILLACMAQVRRDGQFTDEVMYRISVGDVTPATHHSKDIYRQLAEAALRLKHRDVWIAEYPNGAGTRPELLVTGWVQTIRYKKDQGCIELRFNKDILPYLSQLNSEFTGYCIDDIEGMTSQYAIRFYELICQWQTKGQLELSVNWLRQALALDKKYPMYKDFRKRVIEPSIAQVNEHTPATVSYTPIKTGRSVTHLSLNFKTTAKPRARKSARASQPPKTAGAPRSVAQAGTPMYGISPLMIERYKADGDSWEEAALKALYASKR